ncbi:MAG TPA: DUF1398 family protein [Aestuariivirgaceae bacterium]|jgi:uncharacterized protein YbcV (DUF1398 family)|nr:DUF1398 family protein [Aestuariivirgaceae bacterium]
MKHRLNVSVILEMTRLAFANQMPFPASVTELQKIGVERYTADLVRLEKIHYAAGGESVIEPLPLTDVPEIAETFSEHAVIAALEAIQERRTDYPQFLRQIMKAGCTQYAVYLAGRKTIYFGRNGEFHVEAFPPAAPSRQ